MPKLFRSAIKIEMSDLSDNNDTRVTFNKAVPLLTKGIVESYALHLLPAYLQINELNKKSNVLLKEAIVERTKVQAFQNSDEVKDFIFKFQFYRKKLNLIKNKMLDMNHKINLINERMNKIRQYQEYEAKRKSLLREKEEQLIGKSPDTPTA